MNGRKPSTAIRSKAAKPASNGKLPDMEHPAPTDQYLARRVAEWRDSGIKRVKLALTDIDGVMRGKYLSLEKFASVAKSGGAFCDCVLGWDVEDKLYDNVKFTGWHTAFPDAPFRLDLSTERRLADEGGIPFFLGEFTDAKTGGRHPLCPRSLLQKVLDRAKAMGFGAKIGYEYEFFVFDETPHSVREKGYKGLKPLTPGNFGYSVLRNSTESDLFTGLLDYHESLGCAIEGLHCETGPGVIEAALAPDEALRGADKAAVFKTFTKVFFQKRNKMATFMAKWSLDYPGQSGHMHQSLFDLKTGEPVFHKAGGREGMSPTMERYVAGMQKYLKPFLSLCAPTVNSYTRLVKGAWAPTSATWGVENRTTALRVIPGGAKTQRMEFRLGAADGNPYLVAAACIGAGLLGIERKLTLGEPVRGSAYEVQDKLPEELQLPGNLRDSLRNLRASKEAVELFGAEFVDHFANSREWEVREHERQITDWQLQRYFEII
jgi:glutamine synthetase